MDAAAAVDGCLPFLSIRRNYDCYFAAKIMGGEPEGGVGLVQFWWAPMEGGEGSLNCMMKRRNDKPYNM